MASLNENDEKRWSDAESKFLLNQYAIYMAEIGPMKKFKTKKLMWNQIVDDMRENGWIKSSTQIENKYKSNIAKNKKIQKNNNTSGASRLSLECAAEYERIKAMDDSIQPEVLIGVGEIVRQKSPPKTESKRNQSIAETLLIVNEIKEANRERRHQEKLSLFREAFGLQKNNTQNEATD